MALTYYCRGLVADTDKGFDLEPVTRYGFYVIECATTTKKHFIKKRKYHVNHAINTVPAVTIIILFYRRSMTGEEVKGSYPFISLFIEVAS